MLDVVAAPLAGCELLVGGIWKPAVDFASSFGAVDVAVEGVGNPKIPVGLDESAAGVLCEVSEEDAAGVVVVIAGLTPKLNLNGTAAAGCAEEAAVDVAGALAGAAGLANDTNDEVGCEAGAVNGAGFAGGGPKRDNNEPPVGCAGFSSSFLLLSAGAVFAAGPVKLNMDFVAWGFG